MADSLRGKLTAAEIVIVAAGVVDLLFSFFPWYKYNTVGRSAWSSGLFPLATLVPLLGTVMLLQVLLDKLSVASLPRLLGDFTWEQIHLVAAIGAAVIMFCFLLLDRSPAGLGVGFYFDLLAAAALVVGAVMLRKERGHRRPLAGPPETWRDGPPGGGGSGTV
ncbi:MAG: hypothetical protein ABR511_08840 [Acidimicrobiales bacterium]